MESQLFKITQNAIIKDEDGKVLILKHTTGNWLLPGGKINQDETWLESLTREIREETGVTEFGVDRILEVASWVENGTGYYVVTFIVSIKGELKVSLSEEHTEYAWVSLADLDNYKFWHEDIKKRIQNSFS